MSNIKKIEKLQILHKLIANEKTGTPKQLSKRLYVSRRTIFNLLECLKEDYEAPLAYCRNRQTYYYKEEFAIEFNFQVRIIFKDKCKNIFGGQFFFKKNASVQGFCTEGFYLWICKAFLC